MSEDRIVDVGPVTSDNATLLLAAAAELGLPIGVVGTSSRGVFTVPASVAKKAGLKYDSGEDQETHEVEADDHTKDELQQMAKDRGLATTGNKADLAAAINEYDSEKEE